MLYHKWAVLDGRPLTLRGVVPALVPMRLVEAAFPTLRPITTVSSFSCIAPTERNFYAAEGFELSGEDTGSF
jgi:hypothetical protein